MLVCLHLNIAWQYLGRQAWQSRRKGKTCSILIPPAEYFYPCIINHKAKNAMFEVLKSKEEIKQRAYVEAMRYRHWFAGG
jgi:hypothetical protein